MVRLFFLIASIFFIQSSNSFATTFDFAFKSHKLSPVQHKNIPIEDGDKCMNFTGKWDGVCLIDRKNEAVSFEINQFACNAWFLNYEPNFIYLNGVKEVYDTDNSSIKKPYIGLSKFISTFDNSMVQVKFEHYKYSISKVPDFTSENKFNKQNDTLMLESENSLGEKRSCTLVLK